MAVFAAKRRMLQEKERIFGRMKGMARRDFGWRAARNPLDTGRPILKNRTNVRIIDPAIPDERESLP